ncbi:hypothetical protein B0H14DRAFT_3139397 [Mycena olivaceomarginata]|nr:hypothetical protein B0H14DRAFT_3139397 [Mycena olivaceomarginata]
MSYVILYGPRQHPDEASYAEQEPFSTCFKQQENRHLSRTELKRFIDDLVSMLQTAQYPQNWWLIIQNWVKYCLNITSLLPQPAMELFVKILWSGSPFNLDAAMEDSPMALMERAQNKAVQSPIIFAQYLERCLPRKTNVQDPEESGSEDDVMTESDDEDDYVERVDHRPTLVEEPDDLKRGKRVRPIPTVTRRTNGDKRAPRMIMTSKNKGAWNTELEDFGVLQYVVEKWALDLDLHFGWRELEEGEIIAGDQLTIARQRSILNVRLGHESGSHSWRHIVLMPGLFHAKIADCHDVLMTHFGKATIRSPGSLGFHNTVLDGLPITLTSLPPFRTPARIPSPLTTSLLSTLEPSTPSTLTPIASRSSESGASPRSINAMQTSRLRRRAAKKAKTPAPDKTLPHIPKGDMVFENAVLFFRDALLTREFSDAIKAGDSGRVLIILRLWAFTYRGNGRSKYAHEMLHLLHNLTCVWTKELRNIVLQNWLANPQGKLNSFVEIDLVQEHLNFWIKKIYKADGDGHSWDWLALISPCVDILRQLATKINTDLGARQGSKHASPSLRTH